MQTIMMNQTGLQFSKIMEEVNKEATHKLDTILPSNSLRMGENGNLYTTARLQEAGFGGSPVTDWGFNQLSGHLDIPVKFARRIPLDLRAANFNYFLERLDPEKQWLIRSYKQEQQFGPRIRGIMSQDYTKFDDDLFMEMVGKAIGSENDHKILMYHRDERGMHLRIGFPDLQSAVGQLDNGHPDDHMVGIHISNSEVGQKSVMVAPMVYRLVCTNGLMRWQADGDIFRQRHIHLREYEMTGRVAQAVTDAVKGGDKLLDEVVILKDIEIPNPIAEIKKLAEQRKYTNKLTDKLVSSFHEEPGNTKFHTLKAFTRAARVLKGDERVDLERDASRLLTV